MVIFVQNSGINLLEAIRKQYELTILFISHDLGVVRNVCDRIAVMYLGKICEIASSAEPF